MDRGEMKEVIRVLKFAVAAMLVFLGIVATAAACYLIASTIKLLTG